MSKNKPLCWHVFFKKCSQRLPKVLQKWIKNRSTIGALAHLGTRGPPRCIVHWFLIDFGCLLIPKWASKGTKINQKPMYWAMWCPRTSHMTSEAKADKIVIDVGVILTQRWCPKWSRSIAFSCHPVGLSISRKSSFSIWVVGVHTQMGSKRVPLWLLLDSANRFCYQILLTDSANWSY